MGFWVFSMVIAIVVASWIAIVQIVKVSTRAYENVERMKRGYPTTKGELPVGAFQAHTSTSAPTPLAVKKDSEPEYIDYTNRN